MDTLLSDVGLRILTKYTADYSVKLHVRELTRMLNVTHRTISLALQKLEKKQVMIYEIVGKNKQYFLNLKNSTTKEFLKSAESYKTIEFLRKEFLFQKLVNELSILLKTTPVILFGSYAKGETSEESDIDIVIIKDDNEKKIINEMKEFFNRHNKKLQLQKFTKEQFEKGIKRKDHLMIEVIKNHIILNNNEFFIDVLWRYYYERA